LVIEYSASQVWSILTDGSDDTDELIDIEAGLVRLPPKQRVFLTAISHGYTAVKAMELAGLTGNSTRVKREAVKELTKILNGQE